MKFVTGGSFGMAMEGRPSMEVYVDRRPDWMNAVEGAEQKMSPSKEAKGEADKRKSASRLML